MGRPYYSRIARQWHESTGTEGGPFKRTVLNGFLLKCIDSIRSRSILELGAGNGYFIPLMLKHFLPDPPQRIVITDQSGALLKLAQTQFKVPRAEYACLDVRNPFPFDAGSFDLILATMVFNEVSSAALQSALNECHRVVRPNGSVIASITDPAFIALLLSSGKLSRLGPEFWTMPGVGSLRVPVVVRSEEEYGALFRRAGFTFEKTSLMPSDEVLLERPGLRHASGTPLAMVFVAKRIS